MRLSLNSLLELIERVENYEIATNKKIDLRILQRKFLQKWSLSVRNDRILFFVNKFKIWSKIFLMKVVSFRVLSISDLISRFFATTIVILIRAIHFWWNFKQRNHFLLALKSFLFWHFMKIFMKAIRDGTKMNRLQIVVVKL